MKYQEARINKEIKFDVDMIEEKNLCEVTYKHIENITVDGNIGIVGRTGGEFQGKSFYLNYQFDWIIREDDRGVLCLIPLKKG